MALSFLTIAAEESRESTTFGMLPKADSLKVTVPEAGLLRVGYSARFKSSASGAGRAAIFVGTNQLKTYTTEPKALAVATSGTSFRQLSSSQLGLTVGPAEATGADVTTGQLVSASIEGGMAVIWVAAGTYDVSVQFSATSGKVFAKERRLWVEVVE